MAFSMRWMAEGHLYQNAPSAMELSCDPLQRVMSLKLHQWLSASLSHHRDHGPCDHSGAITVTVTLSRQTRTFSWPATT